jgi:hypothetical protein
MLLILRRKTVSVRRIVPHRPYSVPIDDGNEPLQLQTLRKLQSNGKFAV